LKEVDEIGWPKYYSSRDYVISSLFAKLADDEFLSAVEFIISSLPPDEAVRAFCYLAAHLRHEGKRPVLADRALEAAVDILPKCANRAAATGNLLEYGFARLDRERAAELVDEHIVPSIRVHPKHNWVALGLASGGIDFALMHAHKVADKSGIPYDYFVNGEIGLAAARIEPDEVLAWLKKQPASSARGVAAGYIAEGLANRLANQYVDPANHQLWIDSLAKEVLTISDPRQRREACEQVLRATHAPKSKARIILPLEIRQEYGRLWDNPKAAPERPRETWQVVAHARLLPTDMQLREIEKLFVARNTSAAAKILDDSSLAGDLRSEWYDKVLDRARAIPDKSRRAALLVGVAKCLRDENPGRAIDILWEAMALIRPFAHYQPGISPHDVVDYLGSVTPPRNPDEALGPSFVDFRDGGAKAATALWAFAHNLDEVDEREPVLEALAKVLVNHDQTAQAAGLTTLLSSPHRQARIWIEIAARKLGVRDDNRP
jgi:hypothetical protein